MPDTRYLLRDKNAPHLWHVDSYGQSACGREVAEPMERKRLIFIPANLICRECLELSLADQIQHVTVSPEAKQRLMDKYGLTEADFVPDQRD